MNEQVVAQKVVTCRAGSRHFALPGSAVREVCTELPLVRMPGVAPPVEGVINLRGTMVTVVRAGAVLGFDEERPAPSAWFVVVSAREGRVALGVDDVLDFGVAEVVPLDVEQLLEPVFRRATGRGWSA